MSIFLQEPTYITVAEVKATTSDATIIAMSDDKIKELICKVETLVTSYLGYVVEDTTALLDMKIAVFYSLEYYVNNTGSQAIKSFTVGDRKTEYDTSILTVNEYGLDPKTIVIIDKYKQSGFYTPYI